MRSSANSVTEEASPAFGAEGELVSPGITVSSGCADRLFDSLGRWESEANESREHTWEGFSFKQHVRDGERAVIERALRDAGGSVTRAARLLGFRHHQSLISLINSRHKELLTARSAVRKRRRHIFSEPRKIKKKVVRVAPRQGNCQKP